MSKINLGVAFSNGGKESFYLRGGSETLSDPAAVCEQYSRNGADVILLQDDTRDDASHDSAVSVIKEICRKVDCIVVISGHVKRLEDVKKYLYAGADLVVIDPENPVISEAIARFGAEHVLTDIYGSMTVASENVFEYLNVPEDFDFFAEKQKRKDAGFETTLWESPFSFEDLKKNSDGMVPVIVQEDGTEEVLMLAYMNKEAFDKTIATGKMTYFSRSRQSLWVKGETSGHFQYVKALYIDCDEDTILAKVHQIGAACHTGNHSCFYRELVSRQKETGENPLQVFEDVYKIIEDRKNHPKEGSYTNYLFDKGIDKILKKVGEEATEIVIAAKNPDPEEIIYEISDFLYHVMVLMVLKGVSWEEITRELANR